MRDRFEIHFEIERQCLLSCRHCSSANTRASGARGYSAEDMSRMAELLADYHLEVTLTGGEPLLHDGLDALLLAVRRAHPSAEAGLFTTGIVSDNGLAPISASLVSRLAGCGLSFCYVSVYSHLDCVHDAMTRCPGSFAMTGAAIRRFVQAHVDVRFNTVVYKDNQSDLDRIFAYAESLGASEVRLLKLVRHGDAAANWDQLMPELSGAEFVGMIDGLRAAHGASVRLTVSSLPDIMACRPTATAVGCQAGTRLLYVAYDGSVYPCACTKNTAVYRICHISDLSGLRSYITDISDSHRPTCLGRAEP